MCSIAVIVSHSLHYGGYDFGPWTVTRITNNQFGLGRLAVDIFFILSGYLISQSYLRLGSLKRYLWHRFLRIFPAYWICILFTTFVLAPLFGAGVSISYLGRNVPLIFGVSEQIPGLFETNPIPGIVNGSLWTLPWEIRAYGFIGLLGLAGVLRRRYLLWALFLGFWGRFVVMIFSHPGLDNGPAISSGYRLLTFFFAGVIFYSERDLIQFKRSWAIVAFAFLVAATVIGVRWVHYSAGLFYCLAPLPLSYVVFYLAFNLGFTSINSKQDISYGLYVYGTLMINAIASLSFSLHWGIFLLISIAAASAMAWLSWHFIEKPAMSLKSRWLGEAPATPSAGAA